MADERNPSDEVLTLLPQHMTTVVYDTKTVQVEATFIYMGIADAETGAIDVKVQRKVIFKDGNGEEG